jgi:hypothetical protein
MPRHLSIGLSSHPTAALQLCAFKQFDITSRRVATAGYTLSSLHSNPLYLMTGRNLFSLALYRRGIYQAKQPDIQLQPFALLDSQKNVDIAKAQEEQQKWRTSLYMFMGLACAVFILNTSFLAWIVGTRGTNDGVSILYEASCDMTKKVDIGIHLLINILSSALLSASNYCMQCLSAPTLPEVDEAHRKGHWLDIGIPSLHNVVSSSFARRKKLCWWVLALSSFPLHLW